MADDRPVIDNFAGDYDFLSNFHPSTISYGGLTFPTVEHAYQAAKAKTFKERLLVRAAATPAQAKALGKKVDRIDNWDDVKLDVMRKLIHLKFRINRMRSLLLDTDPAELIEGNTWNDTFWGVCNGRGQNHLGKLLMAERDRIKRGIKE